MLTSSVFWLDVSLRVDTVRMHTPKRMTLLGFIYKFMIEYRSIESL